MRLKIIITPKNQETITLPWNYPRYIQGLLYDCLKRFNPTMSTFLHDHGFQIEKHAYKMFVYSLLHGRTTQGTREGLKIFKNCFFFVSSPIPEILIAFQNYLKPGSSILLDQNEFLIQNVFLNPSFPKTHSSILIRTLSPIVASTGQIFNSTSKMKKWYLSPFDEKFNQAIEINLKRKAQILGLTVSNQSFQIKPFDPKSIRSKLFRIKNATIKGWEGIFILEGDPNLLWVAYEAGLGERNAQGFGMIEKLHSNEKTFSKATH